MLKMLIGYLCMLPFMCAAQVTISGRVLNQADTKPVANASVFLSNASAGNKTAANGSFTLRNVKPGKYNLVVSIIGFETYHQTLSINNNNIELPDIVIIPKTIALNEVKIKPEFDPQRNRNFEWFKKEFLGTSYLAKDCKILNPELLDLNYDEATGILTASSVDFLIIENAALGYRVKYLLTTFVMNNKLAAPSATTEKAVETSLNTRKVHYEGSVLFEEMKGTPGQERRWQKRRQQVYEGSEMHFLRSALANAISENGFRVLQLITTTNPKKSKATQSLLYFPLSAEEIVKPTDQQGIYALGCGFDALHITYNKNGHFHKSGQLANLDDPDNTEATIVNFNVPYAFFDRNGWVIEPNSISFTGAWGRNRTAELLPIDYEPPQNKSTESDASIAGPLVIAQSGPLKDSLQKIIATADSAIKHHAAENIYLQFDKPNYAIGDTLWFKAYLFNAPTMALSAKSGIMYVEIANDSSTFVKQYRLPVKEGITWGNISLADFPPGNYTLRAYTSWMRNFGTDGFFNRRFTIADDKEETWLANSLTTSTIIEGQLHANIKLQLSDMNKVAIADKPLQLEVMTGKHHLYKQQAQTDSKGQLDVNFSAPEKARGLNLVASDGQIGNKITIPINLNRPDHSDVQFLPEGGSLVTGLPAHIGFKAIGEDGRGIDISGIIIDHNQKQVATFKSIHNGMGCFDLTAQPNEIYIAKVNLPGGIVKEYPFPTIKNTGITISVSNPFDKDSVSVTVSASNDLARPGESYFLLGKSRGIICYAAVLNFKENTARQNVAKRLFPSGITHFTLTNTKGEPLNERLVFIDHKDNLDVELTTDKPLYSPHDSVALHITVADSTGTPVAGNFSLAVTDDAQVKQDTLNNENILTRLLLTGDLKGFVEEPGYYLQTKNDKSWRALDNLLLTQGWVNYDWQADKQHPAFAAENEFEVRGQVQNGLNGAIKGTHVTLLSKSPILVKDTLTDKNGSFVFRNFPIIDTPAFIIKAVNRHNKTFGVGIVMDDIEPPLFTTSNGPAIQPWYISSDTALLNMAKNNRIRIEQEYLNPSGHLLKEVKITAKKVVKGSQNINGPGNADLVLDETDMRKAGKKSWLEILKERISGFREGNIKDYLDRFFVQDKSFGDITSAVMNSYPGLNFPWYLVGDKSVVFIVDGIPFGSIFSGSLDWGIPNIDDIDNYLKTHSAEDIRGVEVNSTTRYASNYIVKYSPADWPPKVKFYLSPFNFVFIEITTRFGRDPFFDNTPGIYSYKPLALSWPKQFYKPKYTINDTIKHLPDTRSTIDWEAKIITDKNGKATASFYAADKPGTYTLIIEGTDENGNLGYKLAHVIVKSPAATNPPKGHTK